MRSKPPPKKKSRSRKEVFQSFWINVEKRRPPDRDADGNEYKVLIWNGRYDRMQETSALILNVQLDQMRDPAFREKIEADEMKAYLDAYFTTHWMPRWRPND